MAKIRKYSLKGDEVLLEYDPATANMAEVNQFVENLERNTGGRLFSDTTSEAVDRVTRETGDTTFIRQQAGG